MKVAPVEIRWHKDLPIFANESFLSAVGDAYGWLGGFSDSGELRCVLPYTIILRALLRMVRFRVETIPFVRELSIGEEKAFLNSAMQYFCSIGVDVVIPGTTNTIFRTYPDGAVVAPYGSYIIDLTQTEELLWKNIDRITRQNIKTASRTGIVIREAIEHVDEAYALIKDTFKRSHLPFMHFASFKAFLSGLGEYGKILVADFNGVPQSFVVFGYSNYCAYAIYAGNVLGQQGANKLLYWEAIRLFQKLGVRQYDFVGARINPERGSKQEALSQLKKRFGSTLKQGYIWRYPCRPFKYKIYCFLSFLRTRGDIVDAEKHKLVKMPDKGDIE